MTSQVRAARVKRIYVEQVPDYEPDLSYLEQDYNDPSIPAEEAERYREQDRERLEAYNRGEWYCIGIRAVAEIEIPSDVEGGWWLRDKIASPGIWGTESDSDESYVDELGEDELAMLRDILVDGYRFPADEVDAAIKDAS